MDQERLINLAITYYKFNNYNDFGRYSNLRYSYWRQSLSYVCGITDASILRSIFNKMVKRYVLKKVKYQQMTFYVFDIYGEYNHHKHKCSFKMTFN